MFEVDRGDLRKATAIFKLGVEANKAGIHRALNRPPKGKGWVQCVNSPVGVMCRPEKVREAIEHFARAYQTFPDIFAFNQIALGYEMLVSSRPLASTSRGCAPRRLPRALAHMSKPQSSVFRE